MDRRPASLMSAPAARLTAYTMLATVGALEWARMAEDLSAGRAMLWVLAGLAAAAGVLAIDRLPVRAQGAGSLVLALGGLLLAVAAAGLDLGLLRPARWTELGEGLVRGSEALGGVRLPYGGQDPWPTLTMALGGSLLCTLSAQLAVWPRAGGEGSRGHPRLALAGLLTLVGSPIVSLGGSRPLVLGAAVALLTASFLWLEQIPVRPGLGLAMLAVIAMAVALPLGAAADRDEPWWDYRSFAEGIGPADPVTYAWDHGYGPIDWPREGVEIFRVASREPFYWKAESLSEFDGARWRMSRRSDPDGDTPEDDLPLDWTDRPGWTEHMQVSVRRLKSETVIGPGTIVEVSGASRGVDPDPVVPGRWTARRPLGRGDSYGLVTHIPRPTPEQLSAATTGVAGQQADGLQFEVDFPEGVPHVPRTPSSPNWPEGIPAESALITVPAFGNPSRPGAEYRSVGEFGDGTEALRVSTVAQTWALSRRLLRRTRTPYEYLLRVNSYLRSAEFTYTETPSRDGSEVGVERFLFETKRGYCQHFSAAMALLLRMGGIPARIATGFAPGGFRERRGEWIVRDTDAHSWVEAWFDEIGWVTFDPTPPATPARSQIAAVEPEALPADVAPGTAPSPAAEPAARRPEGLAGPNVDRDLGQGQTPGGDGGGFPWLPVALGLAALALAGTAGAAVARRRRGGPDEPMTADAAERAIAELERALRRSGRPVAAGTTLAQLERRLGMPAYVRGLRAARYGTAKSLPTPQERREFRRDLAAGLGWRGTLLAFWALPPRRRR